MMTVQEGIVTIVVDESTAIFIVSAYTFVVVLTSLIVGALTKC